jgi:hypothetical protein
VFWYHPSRADSGANTEEAMRTVKLSRKARKLLRLASSEQVDVTPGNLDAYRELATAGLMEPFSGFMRGPEAAFRFTKEGWSRRDY